MIPSLSLSRFEIFKFFAKLGATGFGGPLALIEEMRMYFVSEKHLLSNADFNKIYTFLKIMPGPVAFQFAVFLGNKFGGLWGSVLAAIGMLVPAFCLMILFGVFYQSMIQFSAFNFVLLGMQFSVAGVILYGLYNLSKVYLKSILFYFVLAASAFIFWNQWIPEPLIILFGGLFILGITRVKSMSKSSLPVLIPFLEIDSEKLLQIVKVFAIAGAFIFGTGLAVFPFFKTELVHNLGFLDLKTFNDGVSFGQLTPGPVTIAAVFYGYRIADFTGAVVALLSLYLIPFFHMSTWFPKAIEKASQKPWIDDFVKGATAAIVGTLIVTIFQINQNEIHRINLWLTIVLILSILIGYKKTSILKLILSFSLINYLYFLFIN